MYCIDRADVYRLISSHSVSLISSPIVVRDSLACMEISQSKLHDLLSMHLYEDQLGQEHVDEDEVSSDLC